MRSATIALGVTVATMAAEPVAKACSPPRAYIGSRTLMPHQGATSVPVNARVVVEYEVQLADFGEPRLDPALEVRTTAGERIVTSVQESRSLRWHTFVLTPRVELEPDTTYEIWDAIEADCAPDDDRGQCRTSARPVGSFTTGDASDVLPPTIREVAVSSYYSDPGGNTTCDFDGAEALDVVTLEGVADDGPVEWVRFYYAYTDGRVFAGPFPVDRVGRDCTGAFHPGYYVGTPDRFVLMAVDLAGNVEELGHEIDGMSCEEGLAAEGGGCATGRGHCGPAVLVVVAAAMARRRRPRR